MVVWSSLADARRCLNGESSGKYEVLLSFEDRELPYQDSYSELRGAWAACRLRGFINITDRSELPRRLRKWHWAGHVLRRKDGRWTRRILHQIPQGGDRRRGRPATRWEDALETFANRSGFRWENEALDQIDWKRWEATFVETGR